MGLTIHVEQILDELLEVAKMRRASIPYSQNEGMEQKIVFVGPEGEVGSMNLTWNDEREKYMKMRAVSKTAQANFCAAVVMISDVRWTNSDKFGKYFHLPTVEAIGIEKWQREYVTIINGVYGGLIKNLPRELWTEAVVTVMKGPRIPTQMRIASYIEGPRDSILFLNNEDELKQDTTHFNLLPDWWV
jgi:hypothetical protein